MTKDFHFMRIKDVIEKTGISRSTIYLKISKEQFPKGVKLGERMIAWQSIDIDGWMDDPTGWKP